MTSIQYLASSICPENATVIGIPAMTVDRILCNIGVNKAQSGSNIDIQPRVPYTSYPRFANQEVFWEASKI